MMNEEETKLNTGQESLISGKKLKAVRIFIHIFGRDVTTLDVMVISM